MIRLLYSSKFWAMIVGLAVLVAVSLGASDVAVQQAAGIAMAVLAVVGPAVYALATGIEDLNKDGVVTIDELLDQLPEVIDIVIQAQKEQHSGE